jgi:hypothetical protein
VRRFFFDDMTDQQQACLQTVLNQVIDRLEAEDLFA